MMTQNLKINFTSKSMRFVVAAMASLFLVMFGNCALADSTPSTADLSTSTSCTMSSYGFSVGLVYCVENAICNGAAGVDCNATGSVNGANGFIQRLNSFLTSYQVAILALSLSLFGLRIMAMGSNQILREGALLLFKIGIGFYIAQNAATLFIQLVGIMGEMISWVSGTSGSGIFTLTPLCSIDTLPPGFDGGQFKVWQMFDCIMLALTGVSADPNAILGGMIMVLVPALFSGMVGVIVFFVGITAIFNVLILLIRALFLVLMSYITIAFLMIFAPVIAPLLAFHQHFTTELFEKWIGLVVSTLFQPVIVVGFLAVTVQVLDVFIEGQSNTGNCSASATAGSTDITVCSYKQWLALACPASTSSSSSTSTGGTPALSGTALNIEQCKQPNVTFASWLLTVDPQLRSKDGTSFWDPNTMAKWVKSGLVNATNQIASYSGAAVAAEGMSRLIPSAAALFIPLLLTLISFLLVSIIFKQMMESIPAMARLITTSTGLGISFAAGQLPFEKALESAGKQMYSGMAGAAEGKGIEAAPDIARSGISSAFRGFMGGLGN